MRAQENIGDDGKPKDREWNGKVVLLVAMVWAIVALGGYYIALKMVT